MSELLGGSPSPSLQMEDALGVQSAPRSLVGGVRRRWLAWCSRDHWWLGRLVELKGNTVSIEGCRFSVGTPLIGTALKSHLLLGDYEMGERAIIGRLLDPSLPVIELGGCLGVVASLTNRRLLRPDRHVVVEAHPELLPLLRHNRDRNGARFEIVHAAVAYGCDTVEFCEGGNFLAGRLGRKVGRRFTVPAVTLAGLLDRFGFDQCTLVSDIEGAESDVIQKDRAVLETRVATLIIEWHPYVSGSDGVASLRREIEAAGFAPVCHAGAVSGYQHRRLTSSP
jgi:FkbM family methyltransferase